MPKASLYDFRDADIMHRLAEASNDRGVSSQEVAELLGFEAESGGRTVATRLAWMRRYGMVAFNQEERLWSLSPSGERVIAAQLKAPELRVVERMPDEKMIEVMALVTSRFQRGEAMLGHMLRREFLYGTKK
jgi:hypothetical protein